MLQYRTMLCTEDFVGDLWQQMIRACAASSVRLLPIVGRGWATHQRRWYYPPHLFTSKILAAHRDHGSGATADDGGRQPAQSFCAPTTFPQRHRACMGGSRSMRQACRGC